MLSLVGCDALWAPWRQVSERPCDELGCTRLDDAGSGQEPNQDMTAYVDDPAKPGPFKVATQEQVTPSSLGMANDKVSLLLPSDDGTMLSAKQAAYPLIFILPTIGVAPVQIRVYGERLASHGFVACLLRSTNETNHDQYRTSVAQLLYFLTGDTNSTYRTRFDKGRVGAAGHHLGGKVAFGLLANNGSSFHAVFGLDPVNGSGNIDVLAELRSVNIAGRKPIGLLGEPLSKVPPMGLTPCTPVDQNYEKFYEAYMGSAVAITFPGATMPDFAPGYTDATCGTATMPAATTQELAVKYLTAYFQWTLYDKPRAREHLLGADFSLDQSAYGLTRVSK